MGSTPGFVIPSSFSSQKDLEDDIKRRNDKAGFVPFDPDTLMHSSTAEAEEFIEHFGVKGMHWGVRRDPKTGIRPVAQKLNDSAVGRAAERNMDRHNARVTKRKNKKLAKQDDKWQKNIYTVHSAVAIHNKVADRMNNGGLDRLNAAHPKAHLDHDTPETRAYLKAYYKLNEDYTAQAIKDVHGVSPSGKYTASLDASDPNQLKVVIKHVQEVRHVSVELPTLTMELVIEDGQITSTKKVKMEVNHSAEAEEFIEHYGVKGMHWGVRNQKPKKFSGDHKKVAPLRRRPAHELTNKQLKTVNERTNLEQNYKRMNPDRVTAGHEAVKGILALAGTGVLAYNIVNSSAGKASIALAKRWFNIAVLTKTLSKTLR